MPEVGSNQSLNVLGFGFFFLLFRIVESELCLHCCKTKAWLLTQAEKDIYRRAPLNPQRVQLHEFMDMCVWMTEATNLSASNVNLIC